MTDRDLLQQARDALVFIERNIVRIGNACNPAATEKVQESGFSVQIDCIDKARESIAALDAALANSEPSPHELECRDVDNLLNRLGLDPEQYRTEGGWLMVGKIVDALAKPEPSGWPVLDKPAQVGGARFNAGVSSRLVVECAHRHAAERTPETEAKRIARADAALAMLRGEPSVWRPIEEAPKDGRAALIFDHGFYYLGAFTSIGHWYDTGLVRRFPTHYMSLPPAPEADHE